MPMREFKYYRAAHRIAGEVCARQVQCVEKLAETFGLRHDRIVAVGRFAAVTKTWQIKCDPAAGAAPTRSALRPVVLFGAATENNLNGLAAAAVDIGDAEPRNQPGLILDPAPPELEAH